MTAQPQEPPLQTNLPPQGFQYENVDIATPLSGATFDATLAAYEVVVVNFFAPWCSWCQRLAPTWEAVTEAVHAKYPDAERRIRFAKVDCVAQAPLCRQHFISAFPSIRIFHKGSDEVVVRRQWGGICGRYVDCGIWM